MGNNAGVSQGNESRPRVPMMRVILYAPLCPARRFTCRSEAEAFRAPDV